jgi:hypothetical protein
MYEHHRQPLASYRKLLKRLLLNLSLGIVILLISLLIGMLGYHHFCHYNWIDSYLNASMILSGMGPMGEIQSTAGKIFAGSYALFSGVVFITSIGLIIAPLIHRLFHHLMLNND